MCSRAVAIVPSASSVPAACQYEPSLMNTIAAVARQASGTTNGLRLTTSKRLISTRLMEPGTPHHISLSLGTPRYGADAPEQAPGPTTGSSAGDNDFSTWAASALVKR